MMQELTFKRTSALLGSIAVLSGAVHGWAMQRKTNRDYPGYEKLEIDTPTGNRIVDYYTGTDRPEVLVMLPGLLSSVSTMAELAKTVLQHNTGLDISSSSPGVILHNRAGYGASRVQAGRPFHIGEAVEDLFSALDQITSYNTRIHLVGHSLGGLLAFRYAQFVERNSVEQNIASVTLLDPTHPGELVASSAQYLGAEGLDLSINLAPETMMLGGGLLMNRKEAIAYANGNSFIDRIWADATSVRTLRAARREWRMLYPMMLDWQDDLGMINTRLNLIAAEDTVNKIAGHQALYDEYLASSVDAVYSVMESANHQSMIADPKHIHKLYELITSGAKAGALK